VAAKAAFAALLASWVAVAAGADDPRFSVTGTASLAQSAPAQSGGAFALRGELQRADVGAMAAPARTSASRFAIAAAAAPASLVCYNDTIFRDDLDGDGL